MSENSSSAKFCPIVMCGTKGWSLFVVNGFSCIFSCKYVNDSCSSTLKKIVYVTGANERIFEIVIVNGFTSLAISVNFWIIVSSEISCNENDGFTVICGLI